MVNKGLYQLNKQCQTRLKEAATIPQTSYGPEGRGFESLRAYQMNEGRSIEQFIWTVQYFYPHSILKTLVLSGFFYISSWITKMDSQ